MWVVAVVMVMVVVVVVALVVVGVLMVGMIGVVMMMKMITDNDEPVDFHHRDWGNPTLKLGLAESERITRKKKRIPNIFSEESQLL